MISVVVVVGVNALFDCASCTLCVTSLLKQT